MEKDSFFERVYEFVRTVPKGKVVTYGQVAAVLGNPRGARAVGWALRALPSNTKVPWQRVIGANGVVSIKNMKVPKTVQVEVLERDGVEVVDSKGKYVVDLKKYNWRP